MRRPVTAAAACLCLLAGAPGAPARPDRPQAPSWARAEIALVAARGLMGGEAASFRPGEPLTAGELADLVSGLNGRPAAAAADPKRPVTIAQLDAQLVRSLGLLGAARRFTAGLRTAGLAPPGRFGTEVVARLLGLRPDHPAAADGLEPAPSDLATRAEAAYSAAKILRWKGWEADYARGLAETFAVPRLSGLQRTVLQEAVRLVGYPYVWGGTSEQPQSLFGRDLPGGFDCSGFVWRLFKLAPYAAGTALAGTFEGRTTFELAAEAATFPRVGLRAVEPADLLFFGALGPRSKPAVVDHIGVSLGGGWMVSASSTGVSLAPVLDGYYRQRFAWALRPLAEAGLV